MRKGNDEGRTCACLDVSLRNLCVRFAFYAMVNAPRVPYEGDVVVLRYGE